MPAHIYYDLGRYHEASIANQKGIDADEQLFNREGCAPRIRGLLSA